jgi:hypothetical protein
MAERTSNEEAAFALARATADGILGSLARWFFILLVSYVVGVTVLKYATARLSTSNTKRMVEYYYSLSPEEQEKYRSPGPGVLMFCGEHMFWEQEKRIRAREFRQNEYR